MATFKLANNYFNDYEAAYNILSKTEHFRQSKWEEYANRGELDQYMTALINADNIKDRQQFYKDYNLEYSDDDTYTAALFNEIFADKTNVDEPRTRYATNDLGQYIIDEDGKYVEESFTMSDYDYNKQVIKASNDIKYQEYLQQEEQERKDSINGFWKFLATIPAHPMEAAYGIMEGVDNLFNSLVALSNGVEAAFRKEDFFDAIVKTNASDTARFFEQLGIKDWIVDFEKNYTYMRDANGEYSSYGKIVGSVLTTMGQMIPAMLAGYVGGEAAYGLGASAKVINMASEATSTLVFYQSMTAGNVRDIYREMSMYKVSPSTSWILANASIKSIAQWGVEFGLGKIFGPTSLDAMVFGRSTTIGATKTLTGAATYRLAKEFVQEGLEEVLQDTSDFFVDQAFSKLISQNFGELTQLTWQSLADSFILGGLASFAGSAMKIAMTKRVSTTNADYDRDGNAKRYEKDVLYKHDVLDKDGNVIHKKGDVQYFAGELKTKKLSKLASWEYGLNMQSFMSNFNFLQEKGKQLITRSEQVSKKEVEEYKTAFTEMYAAFRMLSSIYNNIGEERFAAANNILTKITSMINEGKFDSVSLKQAADEMAMELERLGLKSYETTLDEVTKAGMTKIKSVFNRDDDLSAADVSDDTKQKLDELFKGDDSIEKIILTEDGDNVVFADKSLFVPINYAKNGTAGGIYANIAEKTLVENIVKGNYRGLPLEDVTKLFKQVSGRNDATTEEAVYNLVFNSSFFRIVLSTADRDVFKFVSSLIEIEQKIVKDNVRKAVYSKKLITVIENMKSAMVEYLSNQPNANEFNVDIFTKDEVRKIEAARWCRNLYQRVISNSSFKKLNDNDWNVLNSRVNYMPISEKEKKIILNNLHSEKSDIRQAAMNRIAAVYTGVFTSKYNGKIYMPDTTTPNRTFNVFLQKNNLTIKTLTSQDVDDKTRKAVIELFGSWSLENLLKFRQTQFMKSTNNRYTFRYNKQGNLGIYEEKTNKQVGFSEYNVQSSVVAAGANLDARTIVEKGHKRNYIVSKLLNSAVDDATAAYLSIDDVITDPSLLNEQIQSEIQLKYGEVNIENTFLYLRRYFIDNLKTTTVIVLQDGSYAFGNIIPMKSVLINDTVSIGTKVTSIKQIINEKYLHGRLADIRIRITSSNDKNLASYNTEQNIITISQDCINKGGDYLRFVFLHEFQHAIQAENRMNMGLSGDWINNKKLDVKIRDKIIKDVRKHRPELFKDIDKGSKEEANIVNSFVYFASGESTAYGIDASPLIDFYPVIVSDRTSGTVITMPWGTMYNITDKLPASFVFTANAFDNNLSKKEVAMYTAILDDIYLRNDYSKLDALLNKSKEDFVDVFINLCDVLEKNNEKYLKISHYKFFADFILSLRFRITDKFQIANNIEIYSDIYYEKVKQVDLVYDIYLLKSSIPSRIYDANTKSLSAQDLVKLCKADFDKLSPMIQPIAQNIITQFADKAPFFIPDIKIVEWMAYGGRKVHDTLGMQFGNLLRYSAFYKDTEPSFVETYLHEMVHYLTMPYLYFFDNSDIRIDMKLITDDMRMLIDLYFMMFNDVFYAIRNDRNLWDEDGSFEITYPISRGASEFPSGITNEKFMKYISTHDVLSKTRSRIDLMFSNENFKNDGERVVKVIFGFINTKMNSDLVTLFNTYTKHAEEFYDFQLTKYAEQHSGQIYYQPDFSETFIGPDDVSDDMSIVASNPAEERLLIKMSTDVESIYEKDKTKTAEDIASELQSKYLFVPRNVIDEVVDDFLSSETKSEAEAEKKTETKVKTKSETKVKTKTEPKAETKSESTPDGAAQLEELAKTVTPEPKKEKVEKTKKRYVSQKKSSGTNLEKYGYTAKYKRTQMYPGLQKFIVNATEDIDSSLWEKITSGKITVSDVMDYLRDSETIDDKTFKLINDSFFENKNIKTFEQLEKYIDNTPRYYAVRAVLRKLGYSENLASSTDVNLFDKAIKIIEADSELSKLYQQILDRYDFLIKENRQLVISEKLLRRLWMQYFDGSTESAGRVAAIAKAAAINKWTITGEATSKVTKNLSDEVADELTLEEVVADESAESAFEDIFYSADRANQVEEIMKIAGPKYIKKLMAAGLTQSQAQKKFHKKWEQLLEMNDIEFAKQYAKTVRGMSVEEIDAVFARHVIAINSDINVNKLSDEQSNKLASEADKLTKSVRKSLNIADNIRSMTRTIKSNLNAKDKQRFLEDNGDLFDENLNVKSELLHKEKLGKNGRPVYKDEDDLLEIENRVRKLSKDARQKVYSSDAALRIRKSFEKKIREIERKNNKRIEEIITGKSDNVVTYTIADEDIRIDTDKPIPDALKTLLKTEFNKTEKSKVKYIVDADRQYIKSNFDTFISENAEFLAGLSQEDVDSIIDFYLTSDILPSTNQASKYSTIQIYLMTYLLRGYKFGQFTLTEQQKSDVENRLYQILNISAKNLANWKAVLPLLNPTKKIIQSMARSMDIEFPEAEVDNLIEAVNSKSVERIQNAKNRLYRIGVIQYKGRKKSFFDKLIRFERLAMLSGPGTWIRNINSNVLLTAGNQAGAQIGDSVAKMLRKLLPKAFKEVEGQYKFVGTKVDSQTQMFIKTNFIDNGFLELVRDGIPKYDVRKFNKDSKTDEDAMLGLLIDSIKAKIFNDNDFHNKYINKFQDIVLKALSDTKAIDKAALKYFGKMLVEDKVDLNKGLTKQVINMFADAYKFAAYDYMHRTNFFNTIEVQLKKQLGNAAYFMYKQVFPFVPNSWNWFTEILNYSPIGLAKGIIDFARLENTIERMEDSRQKGNKVISSRFAEYLAKRHIGQGVIGSIGTAIGIALASLGFAGIDEEDKEYRLFVYMGDQKISVDITDVFGTQGILMGIAAVSSIKGLQKNEDGEIQFDFMPILKSTFGVMMKDSIFSEVFNSLRRSGSFDDWAFQQPLNFLDMFVPNFLTTLSSVVNTRKLYYSKGIAGKFESLAVKLIPGLAYAFPKYNDIYTGETQFAYKAQLLTNLANRLLPFKIYPYNVSDTEKEAMSVGVFKKPLRSSFTMDGKSINLSASETSSLNEYYGKLNFVALNELYSNKKAYRVFDEKTRKHVELKYSKMSDKQKKAVIEQIMNDNSHIAKIYILTSSGNWKYYTTESEYSKFRKLGITNVYKKTEKLEGLKSA